MGCGQNNRDKREKGGRAEWVIFLLLLLLAIPWIVVGIYSWGVARGRDKAVIDVRESPAGGVDLVIDPDAEDAPSYQEPAEEQGVTICGWETLCIDAGEQEAEVDFYNPEENEGLYYLTFELRLFDGAKEEGRDYEVLYTSGLVEPGKHLDRITLSRSLLEGEYRAAVHVQPYRMDEGKTLTNNADMKIWLIVK